MPDPTDTLLRRLIGGDQGAAAEILDRARSADTPAPLVTPALLVAAALLAGDGSGPLLARAGRSAVVTRDRQLVAIAAAHLADDRDRLDVLVRDHLTDHPDNLLAAWIAAR